MNQNSESSAWLKTFSRRLRKPRWRLLCCPYAGGSANVYRNWARYLPDDVELVAVQYPGREERLRDALPPSLVDLASRLVDAATPLLDGTPFAIFGHSLGALLAFESVCELRRRHAPLPMRLYVSGACGPRINAHAGSPRHLWPERAFVDELKRINGTPPELLENRDLMKLLLPTLRHDLGMVDTYAYREAAPLPLPIDAFGGLDDDDVLPDELVQWKEQSTVDFRMSLFAGDHFYLNHSAALLGATISERMSEFFCEQEHAA